MYADKLAREAIAKIALESTFNWSWLIHGLQDFDVVRAMPSLRKDRLNSHATVASSDGVRSRKGAVRPDGRHIPALRAGPEADAPPRRIAGATGFCYGLLLLLPWLGLSTGASANASPPVIKFALPLQIPTGSHQVVTLGGTGFQMGAVVTPAPANPSLGTSAISVISSTNITVTLTVAADAVPGMQGFTVTNPDGQSATASELFALVGPFLILDQVFSAATNRLTLVWNSRPGARYSLMRGSTPMAGSWTNVAPPVVAQSWRTTANFAYSPSDRQEFFRLWDENASVVGLHPTNVADLIAFWSFQEAGGDRVDEGLRHFHLREGTNGVVLRAQPPEGAPFGPYAASFGGTRYLWIPRSDLGPLNVSGSNSQVTVVAWLKRQSASINAIAGVWDETRNGRQYCLFVDVNRSTQITNPVQERTSGHVSQYGGSTPGYNACYEVSLGDTLVASNQWSCVALTYDGEFIRSYYHGRFDGVDPHPPPPYKMGNPYYAPHGIFDGGADGADLTVSAVSVSGKMGNWFEGQLGGLAVYSRALTPEELLRLAKPTLP